MYKRIEKFDFNSLQFVKEIDDLFEKYCTEFINEIEHTLLKKYYFGNEFSEDIEMTNFNSKNYSNEEVLNSLILKKYNSMLSSDNFFDLPIDFSKEESAEILDAILSQKLDNELAVKIDIKELKKGKQDKNKGSNEEFIKLDEYINKRSSDSKKRVDFDEFIKQNYSDGANNNFIQDYINRPLYFILYRVRNNILKKINQRSYSIKLMEKYIKTLKEKFKILLYKKIIQLNFATMDVNEVNGIYDVIEQEFLHQYLIDYRLGRTEEEGTKISAEVKDVIQELGIQENIKKELFESFAKLFENYNEADNVLWLRKYKDKFIMHITKSGKFNIFNTGKEQNPQFNITSICDMFRLHAVSQIFSKSDNVAQLIKFTYKAIDIEEKADFIKNISNEFLELSNFTVALQVKDLKVRDQIFELKIADINFLSHELFKSWQFEVQTQMRAEEPRIFGREMKDTHIWVLVKNVRAAKQDTERAIEIAKIKLMNIIKMLYFFISKENEINYEIEPYILVFNEDCKTFSLNSGERKFFDPKEMDDLNIGLIDFINKYFSSNCKWKSCVITALNSYIDLLKKDDVSQKVELQSKIIKEIFNEYDDVNDLAFFAAVIIAGSNISKGNATYRQMRLWLFEDFQELLNVSKTRDKYSALKERICDRFRVFNRNIIGTVLFNLEKIDDEQVDMAQIINWIIYIYPNKELIRREQYEQE